MGKFVAILLFIEGFEVGDCCYLFVVKFMFGDGEGEAEGCFNVVDVIDGLGRGLFAEIVEIGFEFTYSV